MVGFPPILCPYVLALFPRLLLPNLHAVSFLFVFPRSGLEYMVDNVKMKGISATGGTPINGAASIMFLKSIIYWVLQNTPGTVVLGY